jgi:hypothetical protein
MRGKAIKMKIMNKNKRRSGLKRVHPLVADAPGTMAHGKEKASE